jgi:hypothetical protein
MYSGHPNIIKELTIRLRHRFRRDIHGNICGCSSKVCPFAHDLHVQISKNISQDRRSMLERLLGVYHTCYPDTNKEFFQAWLSKAAFLDDVDLILMILDIKPQERGIILFRHTVIQLAETRNESILGNLRWWGLLSGRGFILRGGNILHCDCDMCNT